ncbi:MULTISPECIES: hypothetical protein [unclassified Pseudomonas]|uniref:hypothetical protein n=1 Tax=unclassified Pseudomonas TaxID=196821 RepID=UPI000877291D|nr:MULTISPECIES: hypothetical protein [unclassified Pseudomonas]SCZ37266.1 hypothetical protein SAMN03159405_03721 [Pseudomonas sp. NFACC44-2]SEJ52143.1 hypothetical protein SAMN03159298_03428 [Pseudomonas sp. NFACC07-1]SFS85829.1 hypothetical protein SAMN03159306_02410 [Pseudomonas sp. NFACC48-1]
MKRQLLMSLSLSLLASTAFALPASEQATPQVKDSHSVYSQTVAEGGRDRLEQKGLVEDGYDRTKQSETLAEDGSSRTKLGETLAEDGSSRTKLGETLAEDGSSRTKLGETLAEDGSSRTKLGETLAEGGGDRVIERNGTVS